MRFWGSLFDRLIGTLVSTARSCWKTRFGWEILSNDQQYAILVLILTSPIDWPWHVWKEQRLPRQPPDLWLERGHAGDWHHEGKDWWTEFFKWNAQYFSKFARFAFWWWLVLTAQ